MLYSTFQRRSWVSSSNGTACRGQVVELIDHLRPDYSANFDVTETSDLIDFLMNLQFRQTKEDLLSLFKLCCLCITSASPSCPGVLVGSIDTSGNRDRFTDVVLRVQSYLSGVPGSATLCGNDANIARFSLIPVSFGRTLLCLRPMIRGKPLMGDQKLTCHCCPPTDLSQLGLEAVLCE